MSAIHSFEAYSDVADVDRHQQHQRLQVIPQVLPSNDQAPPLCSRVLQERSIHPLEPSEEQRLEQEKARRGAWELFKATEPNFRKNYQLGCFKCVERTEEAIIRESTKLFLLQWQCELFAGYRSRQPTNHGDKNKKTKKEQVWPEIAEIAFCRALATYPPVGKKKFVPEGYTELWGRNQFIADFITIDTGIPMVRKLISSHIQNISPFFLNNANIMSYFSLPPALEKASVRGSHRIAGRRRDCATRSSQYHRPKVVATGGYRLGSAMPYPGHASLGSNMFRSAFASHKPVEFRMTVQDSSPANEQPRDLHLFSCFREQPQIAHAYIDIEQAALQFPQLGSYSRDELLRTQIIAVQSSIRLMSAVPKSDGAELGIRLEFDSPGHALEHYDQFSCCVKFFEGGFASSEHEEWRKIVESEKRVEIDESKNRLGNVQFGSDFWVRKVMQAARQLKDAAAYRAKAKSYSDEQAQLLEQSAIDVEMSLKKSFETLTAVQEIVGKVRGSISGKTERLLLVCWSFELAKDDAEGQTVWRNVIVSQSAAKQPSVSHYTATAAGAQMYMPRALNSRESPPSSLKWEQELNQTDRGPDSASSLGQSLDTNQQFELPDFSTIHMDNLAMPAGPSNIAVPDAHMYTDHDFDYTNGHLQLSVGSQFPSSTIPMQSYAPPPIVYSQTPAWQQSLAYTDPYLSQMQAQYNYSFHTNEDGHSVSPFSEAAAQRSPTDLGPSAAHSQNTSFEEPADETARLEPQHHQPESQVAYVGQAKVMSPGEAYDETQMGAQELGPDRALYAYATTAARAEKGVEGQGDMDGVGQGDMEGLGQQRGMDYDCDGEAEAEEA